MIKTKRNTTKRIDRRFDNNYGRKESEKLSMPYFTYDEPSYADYRQPAYDDEYEEEYVSRYVEPKNSPVYSNSYRYGSDNSEAYIRRSGKSRSRMSVKMKSLIAIYFVIIAVIATLILVNALPVTHSGEVNAEKTNGIAQTVNIDTGNLDKMVTSGGDIAMIASDGEKETEAKHQTNWFDQMCEWIENLAG